MPNVNFGHFVLVERVRRPEITPKLDSDLFRSVACRWNRECSSVPFQNILPGGIQTVHLARPRFFPDNQLNVIADIKGRLQQAWSQGQYFMTSIVHLAQAEGGAVLVLVQWVGFGPDERTWEPLDHTHSSAPEFVRSERIRKLRLTGAARTQLASEFGRYL